MKSFRSYPNFSQRCVLALAAFSVAAVSSVVAAVDEPATRPVAADQSRESQERIFPFESQAVVRSTQGQVLFSDGGNTWKVVRAGRPFSGSARIRTGANSTAELALDSGHIVRVGSSTVARFVQAIPGQTRPAGTAASIERPDADSATVRAVRGKAQVRNSDGDWVLLRVNSVVSPGMALRTGDESIIDLYFPAHGIVARLVAGTLVRIEKLPLTESGAKCEAMFMVPHGDVLVNKRHAGARGHVEFRQAKVVCRRTGEQ